MKRKIIAAVFTFLTMTFFGLLILLFLGFFKAQEAGVLIESEPRALVIINNKEAGMTPYEANLKPGEILLRIVPSSPDGIILDDFETTLSLVSGVRTIVKRIFKENDDFSSGVIVSFEKTVSNDSYVTVVSTPDGARVTVDGKNYGYTPIRISVPPGDHDLSIFANGFLEKKLPIRVYKGYKLTASVKLAKSGEPIPAVASSYTENVLFKVKINKNSTGFLTLRGGAGVGFPEVGQIKEGEEYNVIETGERDKWYKIKSGDLEGWVSADSVTRI